MAEARHGSAGDLGGARVGHLALRILAGFVVAVTLLGAGVVGTCRWDHSRTLNRADRLFKSARVGISLEEALALAREHTKNVRIDELQKGWRAKRLVADFWGALDNRYCVQFCLDEADRVTEVVPPAQYAEGCFLVDQDGVPKQ